MTFGHILFAITVLLYPISQILEKIGMGQVGEITSLGQLFSFEMVLRLVTNPYVMGGVALSFLTLVFWLGAMSTLKISYMYPFGSLCYIVLAALAFFILKENITTIHWIGIATIIAGCYLINK